jgi:hypothetical protein
MKLIQTLLVGAALAFTSLAAQAADPVIGTWTLDTAKSKYSGEAPKSMTRTYVAQGDAIAMTVTMVSGRGEKSTQASTYKQDGKEYAYTGSPAFDALALEKTSPNTAKFRLKRGGQWVGTGTRSVSDDGKTLTISTQLTNPDGSKSNDVMVLGRSP